MLRSFIIYNHHKYTLLACYGTVNSRVMRCPKHEEDDKRKENCSCKTLKERSISKTSKYEIV
jgi:hypothetical protein